MQAARLYHTKEDTPYARPGMEWSGVVHDTITAASKHLDTHPNSDEATLIGAATSQIVADTGLTDPADPAAATHLAALLTGALEGAGLTTPTLANHPNSYLGAQLNAILTYAKDHGPLTDQDIKVLAQQELATVTSTITTPGPGYARSSGRSAAGSTAPGSTAPPTPNNPRTPSPPAPPSWPTSSPPGTCPTPPPRSPPACSPTSRRSPITTVTSPPPGSTNTPKATPHPPTPPPAPWTPPAAKSPPAPPKSPGNATNQTPPPPRGRHHQRTGVQRHWRYRDYDRETAPTIGPWPSAVTSDIDPVTGLTPDQQAALTQWSLQTTPALPGASTDTFYTALLTATPGAAAQRHHPHRNPPNLATQAILDFHTDPAMAARITHAGGLDTVLTHLRDGTDATTGTGALVPDLAARHYEFPIDIIDANGDLMPGAGRPRQVTANTLNSTTVTLTHTRKPQNTNTTGTYDHFLPTTATHDPLDAFLTPDNNRKANRRQHEKAGTL